jgi:hypothetical protein
VVPGSTRESRWDVVPLTGCAVPERVENPVIRFIRSWFK